MRNAQMVLPRHVPVGSILESRKSEMIHLPKNAGWIARLAKWVLDKTAIALMWEKPLEARYEFDVFNIDEEKILDQLMLSQSEIMRFWRGELKYVVCGPEVLHGIRRHTLESPFSFTMNPPFVKDGEHRLLGMRVVCVPWMTGVVLLPDLEEL